MLKLQGKDIYLAALERKDCCQISREYEYDFASCCEQLNIGYSEEKANEWFDEIQKDHGTKHIRLGIFFNDGTPICDVALQDIDRDNRSCTIGMCIAKLENRAKGYGRQAVALLLSYGFRHLGLERIAASTLEHNVGAKISGEDRIYPRGERA